MRRLHLSRLVGGSMLALVMFGCAPAAQRLEPTALPKTAPPAPAAKPPKERLLALLRAIERPPPVLDLVPPAGQAVLDKRLKALSAEQREQVLRGDLVQSVPLLHLKAGGSSAGALLALATSPVAVEELPVVFEASPSSNDEERRSNVQLAHDIAARAARHFLRDRVLDLANAQPGDVPRLALAIEGAAIGAERPDLVRLALETYATAGAPVEAMASLAVACAFDEDEQCFEQAASSVPETHPEHTRVVTLSKALKARRDGDPIVKSWALLELGRYADARKALEPVMAKSKTDLRVAAALAVIAADGGACPGLQPNVGSPRLCADAFAVRPGLASALGDLESAWQGGGGRDAGSAEVYLGLVHVMPWVRALALSPDAASLERDFTERYALLARVLEELPAQKPLGIFAAALSAGVTASIHAHGRPQLDSTRKQELWFGALGVEAPAPRLAVAAVLAADQPVLSLLPSSAPPALAPARAGLLAWEAAGSSDAGLLENAKGALAEQVGHPVRGANERAASVLLLAELEVAAAPSERTLGALAQVASQLIGQSLPPDLALRGVLDAAGALERLGRTADALGVLTKAAEIPALPGPAGDLLTLIRAEKLVLEWDPKRDPQRAVLAKSLGALELGAATPTIAFAVGAWQSPKILRQAKQAPKVALEERIGVRAADSMVHGGTLRATRVSLRLAYEFQTGITPEIWFDPMFVPLVRADLIQKAL